MLNKSRWFDHASAFAMRVTSRCSIEPGDDTGNLSVDQMVGLLDAASPPEPQETEQNSEAGDSTVDDAAAVAQEQPSEGEEDPNAEVAQEQPPIEAPRSWNAEARAKFAELAQKDRDLAEAIVARETERESALNKAQTEAAETRKRADTELSGFGQYKARLDALLPQAEEMFAHRWDKVDWGELVGKIGAEETLKLQEQFKKEQTQLQTLRNEQTAANAVAFTNYVKGEAEKLKTLAPALADPKDGPAKRQAVGKYLVDQGVPPEALRGISAAQLTIAYRAMLYDQAQAALKAKPPAAPAKTAAARPAARPAPASKATNVAALRERAHKTGRTEDFVAYLDAKGSA